MAACTKCGAAVPDDARFCTKCGSPLLNAGASPVYEVPGVQPEPQVQQDTAEQKQDELQVNDAVAAPETPPQPVASETAPKQGYYTTQQQQAPQQGYYAPQQPPQQSYYTPQQPQVPQQGYYATQGAAQAPKQGYYAPQQAPSPGYYAPQQPNAAPQQPPQQSYYAPQQGYYAQNQAPQQGYYGGQGPAYQSGQADIEENKGLGVLCYLGILLLIPILSKPNSSYIRYHSNQGLLLLILDALVVLLSFVPYLGWFVIGPLGGIFVLVLLIMGIVNTANGQMKPLPLIGNLFTLIK